MIQKSLSRRWSTFSISFVVGALIVLSENPETSNWLSDDQDTTLYLSVYAYALAGGLALLSTGLGGHEFRMRVEGGYLLPGISWFRVVVRTFVPEYAANAMSLVAVLLIALARGGALYGWVGHRAAIWLVALPLTSLFLTASVGFAIGYLTRSRIAVVTAAILPYVSLLAASQLNSDIGSVLPFLDERWDPGREATISSMVAYLVGWWIVSIGVLAACLVERQSFGKRRVQRAAAVATALAIAVGSGCSIAYTFRGRDFSRAISPTSMDCVGSEHAKACFWRQRSRLSARYSTALHFMDIPSRRLDLSFEFFEQGLQVPRSSMIIPAVSSNPTDRQIIMDMIDAISSSVGDPRCGQDSPQLLFDRAETMRTILVTLTFPTVGAPPTVGGPQEKALQLLEGNDESLRAWAHAAYEQRCQPLPQTSQ